MNYFADDYDDEEVVEGDYEEEVEYFDDDLQATAPPPKLTKQQVIDKLKQLAKIKATTKKINQPAHLAPAPQPQQTAPVYNAPQAQPRTTAPTQQPINVQQNNDGRTTCFACGAPTKEVPGLMRSYTVCTACGK